MAFTDEFLNPKSMLTPGIAGAIVTLVTGALAKSFQAPGNWTALCLSFLLGSLVLVHTKKALPERLAYFFLNSLIIFAVAVGGNAVGGAATSASPGSFFSETAAERPFFHNWF